MLVKSAILASMVGVIAFATSASAGTPKYDNAGHPWGESASSYPTFHAQPSATAPFKSTAIVAAYVANGKLQRSQGVKSMHSPSTGIYCFNPKPGIDKAAIYPQVTVEWGDSSGNSLLAFIEDDAEDCASSDIEVRTYTFSVSGATDPVLSDGVAFLLYVN